VVQNEEFLGSNKRLVPLDKIIATTPKSIQLDCTKEELSAMEKFTEIHYIDAHSGEYASFGLPPEHYFDEFDPYLMLPFVYGEAELYPFAVESERIPPGEMAIRRGADVEATDGHVGRVEEFVIAPTDGHITHLVVREGHLWNKKELTLPIIAIATMEEDLVRLELNKKALESFPAIPVRRFYKLNLQERSILNREFERIFI
jgi:sporulation protein YlmC with PRC-barrel domain